MATEAFLLQRKEGTTSKGESTRETAEQPIPPKNIQRKSAYKER
jgi:hypothetical protein